MRSGRILLAACSLLCAACAKHLDSTFGRPPRWLLLSPPEVDDERFPRGRRVVVEAPLTEWRGEAVFEAEDQCERARRANTDDAIDRARAAYGADAKNDLAVRHAVHARCVRE